MPIPSFDPPTHRPKFCGEFEYELLFRFSVLKGCKTTIKFMFTLPALFLKTNEAVSTFYDMGNMDHIVTRLPFQDQNLNRIPLNASNSSRTKKPDTNEFGNMHFSFTYYSHTFLA